MHHESRGSYGSPRVHAELRLGLGVVCGRKRVARLMRAAGLRGVCHQRKHRHFKPDPATHADLVKRQFRADAPDRIWFRDITQHRAADGWSTAAPSSTRSPDAWWVSIADHIRTELVVDAWQMARWQRRPQPGTIVHADRVTQGELNRSSQHLDRGGVWWHDVSSRQIGRCVQQCVRPGVRSRRASSCCRQVPDCGREGHRKPSGLGGRMPTVERSSQ